MEQPPGASRNNWQQDVGWNQGNGWRWRINIHSTTQQNVCFQKCRNVFLIREVPEMCKMHCAGGKERVRGLPHYAAAETGSLSPSFDLPAYSIIHVLSTGSTTCNHYPYIRCTRAQSIISCLLEKKQACLLVLQGDAIIGLGSNWVQLKVFLENFRCDSIS